MTMQPHPIISTAFLVMFTVTVLILHGCLTSCTGLLGMDAYFRGLNHPRPKPPTYDEEADIKLGEARNAEFFRQGPLVLKRND